MSNSGMAIRARRAKICHRLDSPLNHLNTTSCNDVTNAAITIRIIPWAMCCGRGIVSKELRFMLRFRGAISHRHHGIGITAI